MELPHIGKHCHVVSCNQLDFLPFQCDGCGETFCLSHKKKEDHQCSALLAEETSYKAESSGVITYGCSIDGCCKRELAPINCHHCGGIFCLKHKVQEDHACPKLPERKTNEGKTAQHVQQILASRKPSRPRPKVTNPKAIQLAAKVNLMKMKAKAVGDNGVPQSERIFFTVIPPLESAGKQPAPLFFSKEWSIGRVIDAIAVRMNVANTNDTADPLKLRLFHGDTGLCLPSDSKLSDVMSQEQTYLLNGGTVILERVSHDVTELEQLSAYPR